MWVFWTWRLSWSFSLCLRLLVRQNSSPWSCLPGQTTPPEKPHRSGKPNMGLSWYLRYIKYTAHTWLYDEMKTWQYHLLIFPAGLPCGHTHHGQSLSPPWGLSRWSLCFRQVPVGEWCKCKNTVYFQSIAVTFYQTLNWSISLKCSFRIYKRCRKKIHSLCSV